MVAGHEVFFDPSRGAWYCDIELDLGGSYFPFVRLALARYQPMSLVDAHLSRVIQTDFMQVVPDRTAVVERTAGGGATVNVHGYAARNILGPVTPLPQVFYDFGQIDPDAPNTVIRASVERRVPGIPGDLGWERLGTDVTLAANPSGYHVTWTGDLSLPEGAFEDGRHRILLTEIETFPRDLLANDATSATSPLDFVRERVVYADAFEL
jgi:hypothetical protein